MRDSIIENVTTIQVSGNNTLYGTSISSNGTGRLNIEIETNNNNDDVDLTISRNSTIYCNIGDICKIDCLLETSCLYLTVICHGLCMIECDEISQDCPVIIDNYNGTLIPTSVPTSIPASIPASPTTVPTTIPSTMPSTMPSIMSTSYSIVPTAPSPMPTGKLNFASFETCDCHEVDNSIHFICIQFCVYNYVR